MKSNSGQINNLNNNNDLTLAARQYSVCPSNKVVCPTCDFDSVVYVDGKGWFTCSTCKGTGLVEEKPE